MHILALIIGILLLTIILILFIGWMGSNPGDSIGEIMITGLIQFLVLVCIGGIVGLAVLSMWLINYGAS